MSDEIIVHVRYRFRQGDDRYTDSTYTFDCDEFVLLEEKYIKYLYSDEEVMYEQCTMTWIVIELFREYDTICTLKKLGSAKKLEDTELDFHLKTLHDMDEPKRIEEYNQKLKEILSVNANTDVVLFTINDLNNLVCEYSKEEYKPRIEIYKTKKIYK